MALIGIVKCGAYGFVLHSESAVDIFTIQTEMTRLGAKEVDLGNGYSAYKHPPHVPGCQYHLHVYFKQNQLFSLNQDGTAHDQSHGTQIPGKVMDALQQKFPAWTLPANGRIAALDGNGQTGGRIVTASLNDGRESTENALQLELCVS